MHKEKYFCPQSIVNVSKEMMAGISHIKASSFNIESAALLVIDMQNCFFDEKSHQGYVPSFDVIVPNINSIIRFFESKHRPIIYTKHVDDTTGNPNMMSIWWESQIGGEASDIYGGIERSGDLVIEKTQYDAFLKTNLQALLNKNNISSVVIVGVMTNLCVETTARSAFMRGYRVFFPVDATATRNRKLHEATLLNLAHGFAYLCLTKDVLGN